MSRAEDYAAAVASYPDRAGVEYPLLVAVAAAWLAAENGIPSEVESNRWSPVCSAAEAVSAAHRHRSVG